MDKVIYWLPLILAVGSILIAWGKLVATISALQTRIEVMEKNLKDNITNVKEEIKDDVCRLETKQDKYNHLQERIAREEADRDTLFRRMGKVEDLIHEYHG